MRYNAAVGIAAPVSPLVLGLFADRFERKSTILVTGLLSVMTGLAFARSAAPVGWLMFGTMLAACNAMLSASTHNYLGELFPTSVRAKFVGSIYSFTRLATAVSGYLIAFILAHAGVNGVFLS